MLRRMSWRENDHDRLSNPLPPHPLIHHQRHPILELHNSFGRDGFDLGHIQMEAVMQRDDFALHAGGNDGGL